MAEYHVGSGMFGIYAGTLNPKKQTWRQKTECTDEAVEAVRDWMVLDCLGGFECKKAKTGGYTWKTKDGRTVELRISILGGNNE